MVEIEISERARKYGYIFWTKKRDGEMEELLGDRKVVAMVFMNAEHGKKRIDWRHKRISIGWRWTRALPESKKVFILKMSKEDKLEVKCQ